MKEVDDIYDEMEKGSTGIFTDKKGAIFYLVNGMFHRVDGPASEDSHESKCWFFNGMFHRVDGPAIEKSNGTKEWYLHGSPHRLDGPAIEKSNGTKEWYYYGYKADSKEQFYNPSWRKKIEIKECL